MFSKKALQKLDSRGRRPYACLQYVADSFRDSFNCLNARKPLAGTVVRFSAGAMALVTVALLPLYIPGDLAGWARMAMVSFATAGLIVGWLLLHLGLIRDPGGNPVALGAANRLTILRFLLIPHFMCLLAREQLVAGMVVYAACAFTDVVDGWLARKRGEITSFGIVMDPLADIFSTTGMFVMLLWLGLVPLWVFLLLMWRYFSLFLGTIVMFFKFGPLTFKATPTGKIVGVLQALAVIMIVVYTVAGGDVQPAIGRYLFPVLGFLFSAVIVSQLVVGIKLIKSRTENIGS